jgi:hypothetical protein
MRGKNSQLQAGVYLPKHARCGSNARSGSANECLPQTIDAGLGDHRGGGRACAGAGVAQAALDYGLRGLVDERSASGGGILRQDLV